MKREQVNEHSKLWRKTRTLAHIPITPNMHPQRPWRGTCFMPQMIVTDVTILTWCIPTDDSNHQRSTKVILYRETSIESLYTSSVQKRHGSHGFALKTFISMVIWLYQKHNVILMYCHRAGSQLFAKDAWAMTKWPHAKYRPLRCHFSRIPQDTGRNSGSKIPHRPCHLWVDPVEWSAKTYERQSNCKSCWPQWRGGWEEGEFRRTGRLRASREMIKKSERSIGRDCGWTRRENITSAFGNGRSLKRLLESAKTKIVLIPLHKQWVILRMSILIEIPKMTLHQQHSRLGAQSGCRWIKPRLLMKQRFAGVKWAATIIACHTMGRHAHQDMGNENDGAAEEGAGRGYSKVFKGCLCKSLNNVFNGVKVVLRGLRCVFILFWRRSVTLTSFPMILH